MSTTLGTITHRFVSPSASGPDTTKLRPLNWNDSLVVSSAAADGLVMVRDSTQTDGWGHSPSLVVGSAAIGQYAARMGEGRPCGNPTGTPTVIANGAGNLTGGYQYAYYEADPTGPGTTGLSPISTLITLSGQQTLVTVPLPRRGMGGRFLCRTKAGGSVFYLCLNLNGFSFYQAIWPDNLPDSSLVALAPTVDTTVLYSFETNQGAPKFVRTHPDQGALPADFSSICGDPYTNGAYTMDNYGTLLQRAGPNSDAIQTQTTGTGAGNYHLLCYQLPAKNDGTGTAAAGPSVFGILATGETFLTVPGNLGQLSLTTPAWAVTATCPASGFGNYAGVTLTITGAGTTAASQSGLIVTCAAGYTGAGYTRAGTFLNTTVTAAGSMGVSGQATGATTTNWGVQGIAQNATQNVGVFGGLTGINVIESTYSGYGYTSCFLADNGTTASNLFVGLNSGALVYYVTGAGNVVASGSATITGGFGCNTKTAQGAVVSGGALAGYVTGAFGLDSNAHMTSLFNLVVAMRSALVANGIMS